MKIFQDACLADYTSLKAGGPVRLAVIEAGDDLVVILKDDLPKPLTVLGYGCNVLVSDKGLPGTVILNQGGQIKVDGNRLRADSGANWDQLVQTALEHNLWGVELMSGIPGGVGAAIVGNIAAYGQAVKQTLIEARLFNPETGEVSTWTKDKFGFDYRSSLLQTPANQKLVILDAVFELSQQPTNELGYDSALKVAAELGLKPDSLANRRKIIMATRQKSGSLLPDIQEGPWTAGSFFKNPLVAPEQIDALVGHEEFGLTREQLLHQNQVHGSNTVRVSAAHVLLAAGFKRGQQWGQVRLHPDHILKLENMGTATAQEIYNVAQEVIETVKAKLGITLEPEVRFLGEF